MDSIAFRKRRFITTLLPLLPFVLIRDGVRYQVSIEPGRVSYSNLRKRLMVFTGRDTCEAAEKALDWIRRRPADVTVRDCI